MSAATRIFSLEVWKNWEKIGKAEVVKKIKHLVIEDEDMCTLSKPDIKEDLSIALYEMVSAVTKGYLRKDYAKPVLVEIMTWNKDIPSQLVEVIFLVDTELSMLTAADKTKQQRSNLISLIKLLDLDKLYKERLEIETLGDSAIIKNRKAFLTKQIKVRTKMYYKQQKFNLLREESDGYAKLITELNQEITVRVTPSTIIQVIRSLIGCFNLDPNRVLDMILEAFECRPEEHEFYTSLLHLFPHESATVSEILGFKLNSFGERTKENNDKSKEVDKNGDKYNDSERNKDAKEVYTVIAHLLQAKILTLAEVYDWLTPEDSSMIEDFTREMQASKELASRANVVSTKDKENGSSKEKDKEKEEEDRQRTIQMNLQKYSTNQKIQFAVALLEVGNWTHFTELCNRFPEYYLVSCFPVSEALCKLIHCSIDPLYKSSFKLPERLKKEPNKHYRGVTALKIDSIEDLASKIFPMLEVLGPYIHNDVSLMYKLLRIARAPLEKATPNANGIRPSFYYDFLSVLDWSILPAISMFESNPCVGEEVWDTIKLYPYQARYKLYGRWKNETYLKHPALIQNRTLLLKKAKYIMMRITKETIKPVSRGIGKHTHNFPGPIFEYILKQVQLYDNLIGPVVDSFKYLTSLSYDVLGYCIVEILSLNKDRTQSDAMAISPWLQSLSSFCGSLCKKYPLDLGGILQFVANQLKSERSIDILLLKDIVQKMGGTDSMENLTPDQVDAMCGGEHLRREAGQYLQEKNTKRSSVRLKDSLVDNDLAIPLLLLMAQQRSSIVYNQTESPHLKLVGKLYDQCQDTMVQFGSYLFQMITIEELSSKLPPIEHLLTKYYINSDIAFFLARPMFSHMLHSKYDELRRKDKSEKKLSPEDKKHIFVESCHQVFSPLISFIQPHYSPKVWEDMNPSFFLTFWTLTMSDLEVPDRIYDREVKKLVEMQQAGNKLRKRELDRITSLKEKLEDERKRQTEHSERVLNWLMQEKDTWFELKTPRNKNDTVTTFLQLCIFPRCIFTTLDAIYCAQFVRLVHSLKTPDFSTLLCYDRMYCDITYTVTSCTEQEAHHYAKFLLGTLETVMYWHQSKENFDRECSKFPGFITRFRISTHEANDYVDYENYRHVVHKWHYKITKAIVTCLESGDYIQIRNSIFILQGILPKFPAIANLAQVIEKRVDRVASIEKNKRKDLFILANSYSGRLKAKKPKIVPEGSFHLIKKPESAQKVSNVNGDSKSTKNSEGAQNGESKENVKSKKSDNREVADAAAKEDKEEKKRKDKKKEDKRKKEAKRLKLEEEEEQPDGRETREGSVMSDMSSASGKMEPPVTEKESLRSSKRRKTDHESKNRKDEASKKDKKRTSRSRSNERDDASPKDPKKEKKKRAVSPDSHKSRTTRKSLRNQ